MNKIKLLLVCAFATVTCLSPLASMGKATAQSPEDFQSSPCYQAPAPYYDANLSAEPGVYDIFVKLGRRGQSTVPTLYIESGAATVCQIVGTTNANGSNWQKIGAWTSVDDQPVRFHLSSSDFTSTADANRPSIMLVPQNNPPCTPNINCELTYQGQPAFIVPTGTLLSEDSLHVQTVRPISNDPIKKVDYYSDGRLLYSQPELEEFDVHYVPGGDHTLSRVINFQSGQKVVLAAPVYVSFTKDFQNLLFRIFNSNRVGIQILAALVIVAGLAAAVLFCFRAVRRRRAWKRHHGLLHSTEQQITNVPTDHPPAPHFTQPDSQAKLRLKQSLPYVLVAVSILIAIGLTDAYVGQLFRVDGISMETTLQTNDQLYVNKLPKTWASLNRQEYVPGRGDVVVFHKKHSDLFLEQNEDEKNVFVVKRVLGLPGERVYIRDGVVTVFNKEHPEGINPDKDSPWEKTLTIDPTENIDVTLSPSEIFVAGDNRPESIDSRANGAVEVSDLVGRVEARVLPFDKRRML